MGALAQGRKYDHDKWRVLSEIVYVHRHERAVSRCITSTGGDEEQWGGTGKYGKGVVRATTIHPLLEACLNNRPTHDQAHVSADRQQHDL